MTSHHLLSVGKMYIQDKVEEYADEVFDLLVGV